MIETEISGWVYVCVCEAVIWCVDVCVRADCIIVIILVPIISINHINVCGAVYFTVHFYNQYLFNILMIAISPVCCALS